MREWLWSDGELKSAVIKGKEEAGAKFSDYFDFGQRIKDLPSHRALALLRGANEDILDLDLDLPHEAGKPHPAEGRIKTAFGIADRGRPADAWLGETVRSPGGQAGGHAAADLLTRLKERADAEAISVFSRNLKDLLLAAPAGLASPWGSTPASARASRSRSSTRPARCSTPRRSIRTSRAAIGRARLPRWPRWHQAQGRYRQRRQRHGGRETDKLAGELMEKMPALKLTKAMVSEAGASVYSASELAAKEFPDLDVSLRGAVSIARRLQDPLAELVKIDPKSIGVGQYQHDVDQCGPRALARCRRRGLRELGRRRRQHGVGAAAGARLRPQPALADNIVRSATRPARSRRAPA